MEQAGWRALLRGGQEKDMHQAVAPRQELHSPGLKKREVQVMLVLHQTLLIEPEIAKIVLVCLESQRPDKVHPSLVVNFQGCPTVRTVELAAHW
jgi:hypothetical protein